MTDADSRAVLTYDGTTGVVHSWYAYGTGANEPLNRLDIAGATRQTLIPDTQGSIVSTLDSASGTLGTTGYGAYGEHPSLTTDGPAYTAQHHDPETSGSAAEESGLYYYRARMYSPTLGRFLQPDPAGNDGSGTNLYAYVGNDPLNRTDPSGLWFGYDDALFTVGGGVIGVGGQLLADAVIKGEWAALATWQQHLSEAP